MRFKIETDYFLFTFLDDCSEILAACQKILPFNYARNYASITLFTV